MSALALMAASENRWLKIGEGDVVILSSHPIPGNEHNVTKVIDGLCRLGAEVVHSGIDDVHATGHAKQEELKTLLSIARPEWFVPVHGEYRHLSPTPRLAIEMGVRERNVLLARTATHRHQRQRGRVRRERARRLPLRRRHRRRRRPRRAARPAGARRGGRRRGGRHRRRAVGPVLTGPRSSRAGGCTRPRPRSCSTSAATGCGKR